MSKIEVISLHKCFAGTVGYYKHWSEVNNCEMRFSAFLPAISKKRNVPVLTYLSGLTCTEENFTVKAGAYSHAARKGIAIIAPDTSPRGDDVPDEDTYDFGKGAGFYADATEDPWSKNYNMYSYITEELYNLTADNFPLNNDRHGIFGHSMGGHGALTIYLKNRKKYKSVSAFAPICAALKCEWGRRALSKYVGDDENNWLKYDASLLMRKCTDAAVNPEILIDQGLEDAFLNMSLLPHEFEEACNQVGQKLNVRYHEGYDHGYFFIQSFIKDHINHHAITLLD
jgi:S-formylglutathione hydrolase